MLRSRAPVALVGDAERVTPSASVASLDDFERGGQADLEAGAVAFGDA